MRAVVADTGPLYALIDRHDQYHERAQREYRRLKRRRMQLVVIHPVILETYKLLSRHIGLSVAHTWLEELTRLAVLVNPSLDDYDEAVALVRRYGDQTLSLEDTLIAVIGKRLILPIWTFDHHFDILGVDVWR
jgi:predicted nucleic acid-binding protein